MKINLFTIFFILPFFIFGQQNLTPLQITEHYLSPNVFKDKAKYFCCELETESSADETLGQRLPVFVNRKCELIEQNDSAAVVAIELKEPEFGVDYYLYFEKKQNWQAKSMRSLAMTSWGFDIFNDLKKISQDSIEQFNKENPSGYAFEMGNTKLWISLDSEIIAHFNQNKSLFEEVIDIVKRKEYFKSSDTQTDFENVKKDSRINEILNKIFIKRLSITNEEAAECDNCLEFHIAGMVDNSVGFFYQPDPTKVPKISGTTFILIKKIGNGWYLYKTT